MTQAAEAPYLIEGQEHLALRPYKSHKTVHAAMIETIGPEGEARIAMGLETGIVVSVTRAWYERHRPEPKGYFIVYEDGYSSYSPKKAFESGYKLKAEQAVGLGPRHPSVLAILEFFQFEHLPTALQEASRPFALLACEIADGPQNAETTVALRKLLEAKDCAVRARLAKAG